MLEEDIRSLAYLLSTIYYEPKAQKVPRPPITKKVKEQVWVDEMVQKTIKEKTGYSTVGIGTLISGGIISFYLLLSSPGAAVIGLLLTVISGTIAWVAYPNYTYRTEEVPNRVQKEVEREVIEDQGYDYKVIKPSTRAASFGKVGIPFVAIPIEAQKVVVLGPPELNEKTPAALPTLKDIRAFYDLTRNMDAWFSEVPHILSGTKGQYPAAVDTNYGDSVTLYGYEQKLEDCFLQMTSIFQDQIETPITINIVGGSAFLSSLTEKKPAAERPDDLQSQSIDKRRDILRYFYSDDGRKLDSSVTEWINRWAINHAVLHGLRFSSLNSIVAPICFDYGNLLPYSAFNFYCPICNNKSVEEVLHRDYSVQSDAITPPVYFSKNTRCLYDPKNKSWRCPTCESETLNPIPLHKSLDEILLPTFDRLMAENKTERLKSHAEARAKEIDFNNEMEKELERAYYDQAGLILSLANDIERTKADVFGEGEAINSIQEVVKGYGKEQSIVLDKIQQYSELVRKQIQIRTEKVLADVDHFKEQQMSILADKLFRLSRAKRLDDERRDAIQRDIASAQKEMIAAQISQTAAIKEGFVNTASAIHSQTEANKVGLQNISRTVTAQTAAAQSGFKNLDASISRGNAIQVAVAKKQGVNPNDYSPILNPIRAMKDLGTDITKIGKSSMEKERGKLSHVK